MNTSKDVKSGFIHTQGIEKVSKLIVDLWSFDGNRAIRKAAASSIRKGFTILRRAYRDAAPRGPHKPASRYPNHYKMKDAPRQKVRRPQKRRKAEAKVGYNVGVRPKSGKKRAYHAHFPTVGTKYRRGPRGRVHPSNKIQNQITPKINVAIRKIQSEFEAWVRRL